MELEQKYLALLQNVQEREMPDAEGQRLCFQTLSLAAAIDRDCSALLAPHGLSEGRFILLFLLNASTYGLAPNALAEQAGVTRGTVFGLLDGLEREELIERRADANDRRALRVSSLRRADASPTMHPNSMDAGFPTCTATCPRRSVVSWLSYWKRSPAILEPSRFDRRQRCRRVP